MSNFTLDTAGVVSVDSRISEGRAPGTAYPCVLTAWADLDSFTQGYIEAAFFTGQGDGNPDAEDGTKSGLWVEVEPGLWSSDLGFSDLAPETLAAIIADCAKFCEGSAWLRAVNAAKYYDFPGEEQAGRDFWFTRNGHGCGFWDGDWPEPHGEALTDAAKAFPERDLYVGDAGKVYA